MKQSPLLEFECSAFTVAPGENAATNPGIMARLLDTGKSAESLSALFAAVRKRLKSAPFVHGLREEAT